MGARISYCKNAELEKRIIMTRTNYKTNAAKHSQQIKMPND